MNAMPQNPSFTTPLDQLCASMLEAAERIRPTLERMTGYPVVFRIGGGRRTCHQFVTHKKQHRITIGRHCIEDHLHGELQRWAHVREIPRERLPVRTDRVDELLTHVLLHEAAHAVQVQRGGRRRGSVHNAVFYIALREWYVTQTADEARDVIRAAVEALGAAVLPIGDPRRKSTRKTHRAHRARTTDPWSQRREHPIQMGQKVFFLHRDQRIYGVVERINDKTVSVRTANGRWRISPTLLCVADASTDPIPAEPAIETRPVTMFQVGQAVSFSHRQRIHIGVVERVNTKTVSVRTGQGGYRVPPRLLRPADRSAGDPS